MDVEKINIVGKDDICTSINRNLHRYYSIDDDFKSALQAGYLWFSDPSLFNDPYDCNMDLPSDCSYEEAVSFLEMLNTKNSYNQSADYIHKRALDLSDQSIIKDELKEFNKQTISNVGICCFSQNLGSTLMWSHYANKHTGVSVTYDILKLSNIIQVLYNVEYINQFPNHHQIRDHGMFKQFRWLVATKSDEWKYEDEIRIIRDSQTFPFRGEVLFDKQAVKSITFGYKCTPENIHIVRNLISKIPEYNNVKLYKAELLDFKFEMTFKEIDR